MSYERYLRIRNAVIVGMVAGTVLGITVAILSRVSDAVAAALN